MKTDTTENKEDLALFLAPRATHMRNARYFTRQKLPQGQWLISTPTKFNALTGTAGSGIWSDT